MVGSSPGKRLGVSGGEGAKESSLAGSVMVTATSLEASPEKQALPLCSSLWCVAVSFGSRVAATIWCRFGLGWLSLEPFLVLIE